MKNIDDLVRQSKSLTANAKPARDTLDKLYYRFPKGSKFKDTLGWIAHDSSRDFSTMELYARNKDAKYRYNRLEYYLRDCHRWLRIIELIAELAKE